MRDMPCITCEAFYFYVNIYKEAQSKMVRQSILNLIGGSIWKIDPTFCPIKLQYLKEQGSNYVFFP